MVVNRFSDSGLCIIRCYMVVRHSEVTVSVSNESHIVVCLLVRPEHRHIDGPTQGSTLP